MERNGKKKRFRLPISAYITYLLLASFLLTGVTFSKYIAKTSSIDEVRVAKFGIEKSASDASFELEAGGTENYTFTVRNTSDVTLKYNLVLENLPAGIGVTVDDGKAYGEERTLAVGGSEELTLTFTAAADAESVEGSVAISVYAEQAN